MINFLDNLTLLGYSLSITEWIESNVAIQITAFVV